jgi:hypothetical protein
MPDTVTLAVVFAIPILVGFVAGFLTVRANYVLIILLGKVFSSGTAGWRFAATGLLASILVFLGASLGVPDLTATGKVVVTVLFLASFGLGVVIAKEEMGPKEIRRITEAVFETAYPPSSGLPGAVGVSAARTSERILATMPISSQAAITLLLAVFDSRTLVFVASFPQGRVRGRRFVSLSAAERQKYLEVWRTNPRLAYGAHALQILSSYAYYVKGQVTRHIGYGGQLLRDSYLE